MAFWDYIEIAFEAVTRQRLRSILSVMGVTIGVAAVIVGIIIGLGNRSATMQKLAEAGIDHIWAYSKPQSERRVFDGSIGYELDIIITKDDVEYLKSQCNTLKEITPFLVVPQTLYYEGENHTIKALGFMFPVAARNMFRIELVKGRFISDIDVDAKEKVCVVEESNFIEEIFGDGIPIGKYILVGRRKFKVVGIVKRLISTFGYTEKPIIIFPSTALQESIGINKYSYLELQLKHIEQVFKAKIQFKRALLQRFGSPLKFDISEYSKNILTAMEIFGLGTVIIIGIAIISLVVGGVGIMNIMMAMVIEQMRELGIARAIGASKRMILYLIMVESIILSLVGGFFGILIGIVISIGVTAMLGMSFIMPFWSIILGFSLSLLVGIISGAYPARRAAELNPAEIIRQF